MTKPKPRNRRLQALRETAATLQNVGALDKSTMSDFDAYRLTNVQTMSGEER